MNKYNVHSYIYIYIYTHIHLIFFYLSIYRPIYLSMNLCESMCVCRRRRTQRACNVPKVLQFEPAECLAKLTEQVSETSTDALLQYPFDLFFVHITPKRILNLLFMVPMGVEFKSKKNNKKIITVIIVLTILTVFIIMRRRTLTVTRPRTRAGS